MVLDYLAELRDFESTVYTTNQFKLSSLFEGLIRGKNCTFTHNSTVTLKNQVLNYSSGPKIGSFYYGPNS